MNKKKFLLPCIAAVAIATFVGAKSFKTNASESNDLLLASVEALTQNTGGGEYEFPDGYPYTSTCNVAIGKRRRCKVEIITCQGGGSGCNRKKCPVHPS